MFGMSDQLQGVVLSSGYNVATSPVAEDIKSQWLCGGATVWRQEILKLYFHHEVKSRWAICEDVMFSYPIGKKYPLYVCAKAQVRHEHVYDHSVSMKFRYYGKTVTLWRLVFVRQHSELSFVAYAWMILGQVLARLLAGIFTLNVCHLEYAFGQLEGFCCGIIALLRSKNVIDLLED